MHHSLHTSSLVWLTTVAVDIVTYARRSEFVVQWSYRPKCRRGVMGRAVTDAILYFVYYCWHLQPLSAICQCQQDRNSLPPTGNTYPPVAVQYYFKLIPHGPFTLLFCKCTHRPTLRLDLTVTSDATRGWMARGSHSFTCHPHVYPRMEWAILHVFCKHSPDGVAWAR